MTVKPKALKLPDELWLHILHDPALTFSDLKCLSRVCKKLHDLFLDSSLDNKLFRARPTEEELKKGAHVTVHPLLDCIDMIHVVQGDAMVWEREGRGSLRGELNAFRLRCAKDFATSPAAKTIRVDLAAGVQIKQEGGVTVGQLLKEVGRMYDSPIPQWLVEQEGYGMSEHGEAKGSPTWSSVHFYGRGMAEWMGWEAPEVDDTGTVDLIPKPFGYGS